jgi:hypothetical protein
MFTINNGGMDKVMTQFKNIFIYFFLIGLFLFPMLPALATPWTPMEWQNNGRLRDWVRDTNGDFIDDTIEKITADKVTVVLDLNTCIGDPAKSQLIRSLNTLGEVTYVGKYLTFVVVKNVPRKELKRIANLPEVAMVELALEPKWTDTERKALKVENSPDYVHSLESDLGWPGTLNGNGVNIAILDSGVADDTEPDLAGKFVGGADATTDPVTITNPSDVTFGTGGDPHGTSMALMALGTGDEGIAPQAGLVDILIGNRGATERGLELVYEKRDDWNIQVVGLALEFGYIDETTGQFIPVPSDGQEAVCELINLLEGSGIVVVSSAGPNDAGLNMITSPGAASRAISVTAADPMNTVTRTDDAVNVGARGPRNDDNDDDFLDELKPDIATPSCCGTSPASARTSGLVALILQQVPGINPGSVKDLLIRTAEDKDGADTTYLYPEDVPTWDELWGYGETDAYNALVVHQPSSEQAGKTDLTFLNFDGTSHPSDPWYESKAVTTDSLDRGSSVQAGVRDVIRARIYNPGPNEAKHVKVSFGFYPFTAGIPKFYDIGSVLVDSIASGGDRVVTYDWTPPELPEGEDHGCLLVSIDYGYDTKYTDRSNMAQKNLQIRSTGSPASFAFRVENTLPTAARMELRVLPEDLEKNTKWRITLSETSFTMQPHDCARIITATIEPKDKGPDALFHISVYATPLSNPKERIEIGGVGLKAVYKGSKVLQGTKIPVGNLLGIKKPVPKSEIPSFSMKNLS